MLLSASWTSRRVSARMAACDGVVSVPRSCAASETESACGQAAAVERDLAAGVAHLGAEVAAVDLGQLLAGQEPQPEEERQLPARAAYSGEPPGGLEVSLLEHVGVVDPARQPAVEPQVDHPLEPVAVLGEQGGTALGIARGGRCNKSVSSLKFPVMAPLIPS